MAEGSSTVDLGVSIKAPEKALKLLSLSIFSSAQDNLSYGHVQTVAHWWINSIPAVSCLGAVVITQQITEYPAGTIFNVTSGAQELINWMPL